MVLELQPVILAAGEGSKMFPLTETIPKCLLPIGNKPMIWYVVNYLEKYGFQKFFIIVRKGAMEKIAETLMSYCKETSKFQFVIVEDDEDVGTAESLKLLKGKTTTDLLVVSSDMITNAELHRLVDLYRTYDATFCAMMCNRVDVIPQAEQSKTSQRKSKVNDPYAGCRDIVSIDDKENRLLHLSNEADWEQETINFKKSLLKTYSNFRLQSSLIDCHLYIMKNWLLNYLAADNRKFESLKSDFIPHVINKQFSKPKIQQQQQQQKLASDSILQDDEDMDDKISKDIFSYMYEDEQINMTKLWSGYQGNCLKDPIKCYAYVSNDFCLRVNTLPSYSYINRQIVKMKDSLTPDAQFVSLPQTMIQTGKTQIGNDCLVGDSSSFANNITIKKSMIGRNCTIGSNVRITNSIIMDNVTIADGSTIQGSILCDNCIIAQNCSLTNCQVSGDQKIAENVELKGQSIVQQDMELNSDEESDGYIF